MPKIRIDANKDSIEGLVIRAYALIHGMHAESQDTQGSGNYAFAVVRYEGIIAPGEHVIVMRQPVTGTNPVPGYAIVWARSDTDHNHSERVIGDMLGSFRVSGVRYGVTAVFSERTPCSNCKTIVKSWIADDSHVYWIADYGASTAMNNQARWDVRDFRKALPSVEM
jgi:hypothetical protein